MFAVLHMPARGSALAWFFLPPPGYEHLHSHRAMHYLADLVAQEGVCAIRLDYPGIGNSTDELSNQSSLANWRRDVQSAIDLISHDYAFDRKVLFTMGISSSMFSGLSGIHAHIKWVPEERPRAYVRRQKVIGGMSRSAESESTGYTDVAGFRFNDQLFNEIARHATTEDESVVVIQPGVEPTAELFDGDGLEGVLVEPHHGQLPKLTAEAVLEICRTQRAEHNQSAASQEQTKVMDSVQHASYSEKASFVGKHALFTVHTKANDCTASDLLVVIANAGSNYNIGPHRMYVELSRTLAAAGCDSVRFDLRQIGNSVQYDMENENKPHCLSAIDDVRDICQWAQQSHHYQKFVLMGLCSGGHTALHATLELASQFKIVDCVMLNPLTFDFSEDLPLDVSIELNPVQAAAYYRRTAKDPDAWFRLLSGKISLLPLVSYTWSRSRQILANIARGVGESLGVVPRPALDEKLNSLRKQGVRLSLVHATADPGLDLYLHAGGRLAKRLLRSGYVRYLPIVGGDHTFTDLTDREAAIAHVCDLFHSNWSR